TPRELIQQQRDRKQREECDVDADAVVSSHLRRHDQRDERPQSAERAEHHRRQVENAQVADHAAAAVLFYALQIGLFHQQPSEQRQKSDCPNQPERRVVVLIDELALIERALQFGHQSRPVATDRQYQLRDPERIDLGVNRLPPDDRRIALSPYVENARRQIDDQAAEDDGDHRQRQYHQSRVPALERNQNPRDEQKETTEIREIGPARRHQQADHNARDQPAIT